jgi:hypothetical protein
LLEFAKKSRKYRQKDTPNLEV